MKSKKAAVFWGRADICYEAFLASHSCTASKNQHPFTSDRFGKKPIS